MVRCPHWKRNLDIFGHWRHYLGCCAVRLKKHAGRAWCKVPTPHFTCFVHVTFCKSYPLPLLLCLVKYYFVLVTLYVHIFLSFSHLTPEWDLSYLWYLKKFYMKKTVQELWCQDSIIKMSNLEVFQELLELENHP